MTDTELLDGLRLILEENRMGLITDGEAREKALEHVDKFVGVRVTPKRGKK